MDPTTFQICVANHLERLLEGQAALVNALSSAVELFQYEFQLIRCGAPHQNQGRNNVMETADLPGRDASFQRLNACLSNWKASIGANCLNGEFSLNNNNKTHKNCVGNNASNEYDDEDSFTDTSSSHRVEEKTRVLQSKGESGKVENGVGSEGETNAVVNIIKEERDLDFLDSSSEISMMNMPGKHVKHLTMQEEISRKRAGDRRRSAYYRIRKKAAEAGLPPPEFAKLRISRRDWEKTTSSDEVEEESKKEAAEDEDVGFWENVPSRPPRKNLKCLTSDEKLLYKREMNKQRVKAYRMRKKAEKSGVPAPDFAKLRCKSSETNLNRFGDSNNSCSSYESAQQNTVSTENKTFSCNSQLQITLDEIS